MYEIRLIYSACISIHVGQIVETLEESVSHFHQFKFLSQVLETSEYNMQ